MVCYLLLLTLNVEQKCSEQKLTLPWCIDLERHRCKLWHGSQTPQNKSDIERIIRGFIYAKVISKLKLERMGPLLDFGHWPYFMPLFHKLFYQSTHRKLKIAHFFKYFNHIQPHILQ